MATQFLSSLHGAGIVPTFSVDSIRVSTDAPTVDVRFECENPTAGAPRVFYTATYSAHNGMVEIHEVSDIVEDYFRAADKVLGTITIHANDTFIDVEFLYCEYFLPEIYNPQHMLYLASTAQQVRPDSSVAFATLPVAGAEFVIRAVGNRAEDGKIGMYRYTPVAQLNSRLTTHFAVADIVKKATSEEGGLSNVKMFSIEYTGLQKVCFLTKTDYCLRFSYRNGFNVEEYIDVPGTFTSKTELSVEQARIGKAFIPYDRTVSRSYEMNTGPIGPWEQEMYEQFLYSAQTSLWLHGEEYPVLITEADIERSNDDDVLNTVKFTWIFANGCPRALEKELQAMKMPHGQAFNPSFSQEYE